MNETLKNLRLLSNEHKSEHYNTPENLTKSIIIKAAKILEIYQETPDDTNLGKTKNELTMLFEYTLMLVDYYGIDVVDELLKKIEKSSGGGLNLEENETYEKESRLNDILFLYDENNKEIAKARYIGTGFSKRKDNEIIIYKGSLIKKEHKPSKKWDARPIIAKERKKLLENNLVEDFNDEYYKLKKDIIYESPNRAADVIYGDLRSDALKQFVNKDGQTLEELKNEMVNIEKSNESAITYDNYEKQVTKILSSIHNKYVNEKEFWFRYTADEEAAKLVTDLDNHPEAFFLGCIMNRQIRAERAFAIPKRIFDYYGTLDFNALSKVSLNDWIKFFETEKIHRLNKDMAQVVFLAIRKVNHEYEGHVERIWNETADAEVIISRLKSFHGVGDKIATMITNILLRDFKLPITNLKKLDISTDVHVLRVFKRLGLIEDRTDIKGATEMAQKLSPEFPGIVDATTWYIGREYCFETNPRCHECPLDKYCKKLIY